MFNANLEAIWNGSIMTLSVPSRDLVLTHVMKRCESVNEFGSDSFSSAVLSTSIKLMNDVRFISMVELE